MSKKNKRLLCIAAAALVVLIAVFAWLYFANKPKTNAGAKHISVEVITAGKQNTYEYDTDAEYLRQVLADENGLISGADSEYGMFVTTVDGITAVEANEEWWCFTKGGEMLMTGVDDTPIADGDKFEITLAVGYDF